MVLSSCVGLDGQEASGLEFKGESSAIKVSFVSSAGEQFYRHPPPGYSKDVDSVEKRRLLPLISIYSTILYRTPLANPYLLPILIQAAYLP